jgi:hypothetical protein
VAGNERTRFGIFKSFDLFIRGDGIGSSGHEKRESDAGVSWHSVSIHDQVNSVILPVQQLS